MSDALAACSGQATFSCDCWNKLQHPSLMVKVKWMMTVCLSVCLSVSL